MSVDITPLTNAVAEAIEDVRTAFPNSSVEVHPDGDGGAYVIVDPVDLGDRYEPPDSWIGFHITFQYPLADCYPHFVRSDLTRVDGKALGAAMTAGAFGFDDRSGIQVSRRSNRLNPEHDTALTKLWNVIDWVKVR